MAEPTLTDIAGMLEQLIGMLTPKTEEGKENDEERVTKKMRWLKPDKTVITLEKAKADAAGAWRFPLNRANRSAGLRSLHNSTRKRHRDPSDGILRKLGL
jgi:hypothetical protein